MMKKYNKSDYWFNDLGVLVDPNKMGEVFPYHDMTYPEKMNSLVRLSILLGLTLCLLYQRIKYIYIPLIVMGGTFVLYLLINPIWKAVKIKVIGNSPQTLKLTQNSSD